MQPQYVVVATWSSPSSRWSAGVLLLTRQGRLCRFMAQWHHWGPSSFCACDFWWPPQKFRRRPPNWELRSKALSDLMYRERTLTVVLLHFPDGGFRTIHEPFPKILMEQFQNLENNPYGTPRDFEGHSEAHGRFVARPVCGIATRC